MMLKRAVSAVLATAVAAGMFLVGAARPAEAKGSENLWRLGTYLGAAGTGVALAKGRGTWALIGAGATALSYSQWKKSVSRRHRDQRLAASHASRYRNTRYYGSRYASRGYSRTSGYRGSSRSYSTGRRVAHSHRSTRRSRH